MKKYKRIFGSLHEKLGIEVMTSKESKKALITGIAGQDGYYLSQLLLRKGYQVYGFSRNLEFSLENVKIFYGDLNHPASIQHAIRMIQPAEIYHLAAQSSPRESWSRLTETLRINGEGAVLVYEASRRYCPTAKIYQSSSSEMFGDTTETPQNEKTPFNPCDPYAAAKVYAHQMAGIYRRQYKQFIACGILFNHESERRPLQYVTQKIAYGTACAALGIINSPECNELGRPIVQDGLLSLGDLTVSRDWGSAEDYVEAMWLMLQQEKPEDFVIGTGKSHTLSQLCEMAYTSVGLNWQDHVQSDQKLHRATNHQSRLADPSYAMQRLDWHSKTPLSALIQQMVKAQIKKLKANTITKMPPAYVASE